MTRGKLIHNPGPWTGVDQIEFATMEYIGCCNPRGIHGERNCRTPVEAERDYFNHETLVCIA